MNWALKMKNEDRNCLTQKKALCGVSNMTSFHTQKKALCKMCKKDSKYTKQTLSAINSGFNYRFGSTPALLGAQQTCDGGSTANIRVDNAA